MRHAQRAVVACGESDGELMETGHRDGVQRPRPVSQIWPELTEQSRCRLALRGMFGAEPVGSFVRCDRRLKHPCRSVYFTQQSRRAAARQCTYPPACRGDGPILRPGVGVVAQNLLEAINTIAHALESACRQSGKRSSHSGEIHPHTHAHHVSCCPPLNVCGADTKQPCRSNPLANQTMPAELAHGPPKGGRGRKACPCTQSAETQTHGFHTPKPSWRADQTRDGKTGGRRWGPTPAPPLPPKSHRGAEARGAMLVRAQGG